MIDEDFFLSLPDEPEHAFPLYEARVRAELGERTDEGWEWEREYIQHIKAFVKAYLFEIEDLPTYEPDSDQFAQYATRFLEATGVAAKAYNLVRLRAARTAIAPPYVLEPAQKMEIHHHIEQIRGMIAKADITQQKRDALADKLNAFAAEVDRDRTRLDALTSMYIFAKREAKEELEPLLDKLNKLFEIFEKATEWTRLPESKKRKELPAPQKKIEGPKDDSSSGYEFDDDIPF